AAADAAVPGTIERFRTRLNAGIVDGARARLWQLWDLDGLASRIGRDRWFDPVHLHHGKMPFSVHFAPRAADHLAGLLAALSGLAGRALVLDLDNTLWGGSIGDDGID